MNGLLSIINTSRKEILVWDDCLRQSYSRFTQYCRHDSLINPHKIT